MDGFNSEHAQEAKTIEQPTHNGSPTIENSNIIDIFIASIIGFDYLVLLPIFFFAARVLHKNKQIQIFRSRRPIALLYILVVTFIFFVLVHPYRLFDGSIPNSTIHLFNFIPSWISSTFEYCVTLALLLCYAQRTYLIHYDFNYHEAILNNEWKQFTSNRQDVNQWFLSNRNKFGNRAFTLYICLTIWFILSTLLTFSVTSFSLPSHL